MDDEGEGGEEEEEEKRGKCEALRHKQISSWSVTLFGKDM